MTKYVRNLIKIWSSFGCMIGFAISNSLREYRKSEETDPSNTTRNFDVVLSSLNTQWCGRKHLQQSKDSGETRDMWFKSKNFLNNTAPSNANDDDTPGQRSYRAALHCALETIAPNTRRLETEKSFWQSASRIPTLPCWLSLWVPPSLQSSKNVRLNHQNKPRTEQCFYHDHYQQPTMKYCGSLKTVCNNPATAGLWAIAIQLKALLVQQTKVCRRGFNKPTRCGLLNAG